MFVLPLTTRIIGGLLALVILAWGWAKHKAIRAFTSALSSKATRGFWSYVNKRVKAADKPSSASATPKDQRTYKGRFCHYLQYENPPRERFFEIETNGTFTKVPVMKTNLFSGLNPGELVEIDTQVGIYHGYEVVLRVRVLG